MGGLNGEEARAAMLQWMAYVEASGDTPWNFGKVWTLDDGWKVAWKVGDKAMLLDPAWARKHCREMRRNAEIQFRKLPKAELEKLQPESILAVFDDWDEHAKACLHLNRANIKPRAVGGTYDEPVTTQ